MAHEERPSRVHIVHTTALDIEADVLSYSTSTREMTTGKRRSVHGKDKDDEKVSADIINSQPGLGIATNV